MGRIHKEDGDWPPAADMKTWRELGLRPGARFWAMCLYAYFSNMDSSFCVGKNRLSMERFTQRTRFCAWRDADFQHKHAAGLEAIHEQIKHGLLVLRAMNGREKNDYVKLVLAQIAPVLANELAARKSSLAVARNPSLLLHYSLPTLFAPCQSAKTAKKPALQPTSRKLCLRASANQGQSALLGLRNRPAPQGKDW